MTRILIVGAGATGGYFGARLARAARDVTFLVRLRRAAELRADGLRITTLEGSERLEPKLVTATELDGPYDLVLLTVKAGSLEAGLQDLKPAVGPRTAIVPFLNGIDHLDVIDTQFPSAVLGAVVKVAAQLTPDGATTVSAPGASLEIGELDGGHTARLRDTAAALDVVGFDVQVSDRILTSMWHKWVFIATTTTITCIAQGTIGDVAAVSGGKGFADAVLAEAAAVSGARRRLRRAAGHRDAGGFALRPVDVPGRPGRAAHGGRARPGLPCPCGEATRPVRSAAERRRGPPPGAQPARRERLPAGLRPGGRQPNVRRTALAAASSGPRRPVPGRFLTPGEHLRSRGCGSRAGAGRAGRGRRGRRPSPRR
ncbi:2-dehydropantoate 2-reductase [Streptomyces sp. FXJ1.4098]|nr:2-dehydropantoate 2-reductase [Streptomyces sp. FXJ1.4098]